MSNQNNTEIQLYEVIPTIEKIVEDKGYHLPKTVIGEILLKLKTDFKLDLSRRNTNNNYLSSASKVTTDSRSYNRDERTIINNTGVTPELFIASCMGSFLFGLLVMIIINIIT